MTTLDALGHNGSYRTRNRLPLTDVAGAPMGELSLVPPLYVTRAMSALRKARPLPVSERARTIAAAGELFATGEVDGMSAADYRLRVSRMSGTPMPVVVDATEMIARFAAGAYDRVLQSARPVGAMNDWRDESLLNGGAVWIRRGDVFAVHAAGNSPGVHAGWLEALAAGYRVAIRPSRREPLTPHRLVSALRTCGFDDDHVVLLPTDHSAADEILRRADLGMVYGGQDVIDKYAADPTILPNGPGRSKILITADQDWREYVDLIVDSVSGLGGTACVNTTAVFVEGDPGPVAAAVAERLAMLPSLPPEHEKAVLPVYPLAAAKAIEAYLLAKSAGAKAHLGGDGVVDPLEDGGAALRPAVFELADPNAPQARVELGFPCVWVAPWTREAGVAPLCESLVLTAVTADEELIDELLHEPSIRNLYIGDHPTHWMAPGVPHDGFLGEFLMRGKAVIRR